MKGGSVRMDNAGYEFYHEKKPHVAAGFPYNTYLCSIPLDFTQVNTHWHEEAEFIIIKKGCGEVNVDLRPYTVMGGDIILVLPGQLHSICQHGNDIMEYENILFSPKLLYGNGMDFCTVNYLYPFFGDNFVFPVHINKSVKKYSELYACIEFIDGLRANPVPGCELGIKGGLLQFFSLLFTNLIDINTKKPLNRNAARLKEILYYINAYYNEPLTPSDVAEAVGFSASHFMKFFKKSMGCTFTEYLNDYRLSIACTLLSTTDKSILVISCETGFTNLSYFNRLFKKKYGISPRIYRNSL